MVSIPKEFIDESIEFYLSSAIEELRNKKYKNQADYRKLICDFFNVKIKLYKFAHNRIGLYPDSLYLLSILDQVCIASFFGIGLDDSIEKHITNDGLFWGIFILLIRQNEFPSFQLKQITESVNRNSRIKSKQLVKQAAYGVAEICDSILKNSLRAVGVFNDTHASTALKKFNSQSNMILTYADNLVKSAIKEIKENLDSYGNILVYRGFDFGPKDSVRKGLKKIGNEHAHIQETGVGLSFTLDKLVAKQFALSKWLAMHSDEISWESRTFNSHVLLEKSGVDLQKFLADKERFAAVGTYKVKEKNIICNLAYDKNNVGSECELMILPENLELVSYNIIKSTKYST